MFLSNINSNNIFSVQPDVVERKDEINIDDDKLLDDTLESEISRLETTINDLEETENDIPSRDHFANDLEEGEILDSVLYEEGELINSMIHTINEIGNDADNKDGNIFYLDNKLPNLEHKNVANLEKTSTTNECSNVFNTISVDIVSEEVQNEHNNVNLNSLECIETLSSNRYHKIQRRYDNSFPPVLNTRTAKSVINSKKSEKMPLESEDFEPSIDGIMIHQNVINKSHLITSNTTHLKEIEVRDDNSHISRGFSHHIKNDTKQDSSEESDIKNHVKKLEDELLHPESYDANISTELPTPSFSSTPCRIKVDSLSRWKPNFLSLKESFLILDEVGEFSDQEHSLYNHSNSLLDTTPITNNETTTHSIETHSKLNINITEDSCQKKDIINIEQRKVSFGVDGDLKVVLSMNDKSKESFCIQPPDGKATSCLSKPTSLHGKHQIERCVTELKFKHVEQEVEFKCEDSKNLSAKCIDSMNFDKNGVTRMAAACDHENIAFCEDKGLLKMTGDAIEVCLQSSSAAKSLPVLKNATIDREEDKQYNCVPKFKGEHQKIDVILESVQLTNMNADGVDLNLQSITRTATIFGENRVKFGGNENPKDLINMNSNTSEILDMQSSSTTETFPLLTNATPIQESCVSVLETNSMKNEARLETKVFESLCTDKVNLKTEKVEETTKICDEMRTDNDSKGSTLISNGPSTEYKSNITSNYNQDYVSNNPQENADNNNPEWELLRKLETDVERYRAMRKRWRNLVIPDPNQDLTYRNWRIRQNANKIKISASTSSSVGEKINTTECHTTFVKPEYNHKRTLSEEPASTEVRPNIKRPRTQSCTAVFDIKLEDLRRNIEHEKQRISVEEHIAVQNLTAQLTEEANYFQNCSYKYTNFNEERLRLQHRHHGDMERVHRKFDDARHAVDMANLNKVQILEKACQEVRAFHKYYQGLDRESHSGDALFLSEAQTEELWETERLYDQFNKFYAV